METTPRSDESARELGARSRAAGIVLWCAFLAAATATMVCFAFVDPDALRIGDAPGWWSDRPTIYALGFFLFWLTAAGSSALTLYLLRTERRK